MAFLALFWGVWVGLILVLDNVTSGYVDIVPFSFFVCLFLTILIQLLYSK